MKFEEDAFGVFSPSTGTVGKINRIKLHAANRWFLELCPLLWGAL